MNDESSITLDFEGDDDLGAQLNALSNDRLLALQQELDDIINMRRELGELED